MVTIVRSFSTLNLAMSIFSCVFSYKLLIFYPIIWMLVGMEVGQTMLVVWLHAPAGHTRAGARVAEAGESDKMDFWQEDFTLTLFD